MSTWDALKLQLGLLAEDPSQPLKGYPDPRVDVGRVPPFRIWLAAWAVDAAQTLYELFGQEVQIQVGHLHYPDPTRPDWLDHLAASRPPVVDSAELTVELAEEIDVASGHDRMAELWVGNRTEADLEIRTGGELIGLVVDPRTGDIVGTYAGARRAVLRSFRIAPRERRALPLLVGTASVVPALGYAVRPGSWQLEAVVDLGHRQYRTPPFPLKVSP